MHVTFSIAAFFSLWWRVHVHHTVSFSIAVFFWFMVQSLLDERFVAAKTQRRQHKTRPIKDLYTQNNIAGTNMDGSATHDTMLGEMKKVFMFKFTWLGSNASAASFAASFELLRELKLGAPVGQYAKTTKALMALVEQLSKTTKVWMGNIKLLKPGSSFDLNVCNRGRHDVYKAVIAWTQLLLATPPRTPLQLFVTSRSDVDHAVNTLRFALNKSNVCREEFAEMPLALRNNARVATIAIEAYAHEWEDVGPELLSNKAFMTKHISKSRAPFKYGDILWSWKPLKYAGENLKQDADVVELAVLQNPEAYLLAASTLQQDEAFVIRMVKRNYFVFEHAAKHFGNNKNVALASVTNNGLALQWASSNLREDKEVVLASVANCGVALQWASSNLRKNRQVVLASVTNNGRALQWASSDLRKDNGLICVALKTCPSAVKHSDQSSTLECMAAACLINGKAFSQIPRIEEERRHLIRLMIRNMSQQKKDDDDEKRKLESLVNDKK